MSPHETLFLESTASCDVSNNLSNRLVQFQTWDFGGDLSLQSDVHARLILVAPALAAAGRGVPQQPHAGVRD